MVGSMSVERVRGWLFMAAVTAASRGLQLRDRLQRVVDGLRRPRVSERFLLKSGGRRLDAVWVPGEAAKPAVLLCHGIGETVDHWRGVQAYLEEHGIGSLVFDYSGYGKSSGHVCAAFCDEDLVTAYAEVRRRVGDAAPVFMLGFSLGSGIAAHGAAALRPRPAGLVLCEAFTSFREAACASGVPRWMWGMVPAIWDSVEAVRVSGLRTLVVHSDADELFPVEMGRQIAEAGGAEMVEVPGYGHSALYLRPEDGYWGPVVRWMLGRQ